MPLPLDRLAGLARVRRRVRRAVLRRRRVLAALLAAVAVATGIRAVSAPPPPTETVLTAVRDLPAGSVLTEEDLIPTAYAHGTRPDRVVADPVGRVLAAPLARGEPVTDVRLVGPALAASDPSLAAVPVRLPDAAMAGLLEVGDEIDLIATDPQSGTSTLVAAGVPVLALPPEGSSDGSGVADQPGALVVVGADPADLAELSGAAVRLFLTYAWSR